MKIALFPSKNDSIKMIPKIHKKVKEALIQMPPLKRFLASKIHMPKKLKTAPVSATGKISNLYPISDARIRLSKSDPITATVIMHPRKVKRTKLKELNPMTNRAKVSKNASERIVSRLTM